MAHVKRSFTGKQNGKQSGYFKAAHCASSFLHVFVPLEKAISSCSCPWFSFTLIVNAGGAAKRYLRSTGCAEPRTLGLGWHHMGAVCPCTASPRILQEDTHRRRHQIQVLCPCYQGLTQPQCFSSTASLCAAPAWIQALLLISTRPLPSSSRRAAPRGGACGCQAVPPPALPAAVGHSGRAPGSEGKESH